MKNKKQWLRLNIQHFATPAFNPDNVLISDFRTGSVPTEHAAGIVSNTMNGSAVMKLATYEPMTTLCYPETCSYLYPTQPKPQKPRPFSTKHTPSDLLLIHSQPSNHPPTFITTPPKQTESPP